MIEESLKTRLDLLRNSGQVDPDVATFVAGWLRDAGDALSVDVTEANFAMFCTHTALALQRARRGEAIEDWSADHSAELARVPQAISVADDFVRLASERLNVELPRQERDFVALHLAAMTMRSARA